MKNENKNCLFVVSTLDSGGIENFLLRFLKSHHKKFKTITVFCKGGRTGQLENQYRSISNLEIKTANIGYLNIFSYHQLYVYLKSNKFDSICDFTGNFAGNIMLIAKKANINKRVAFYRGSTNRFQETPLKLTYNKFVNKLTFKYATDILSNSKAGLKFFFPDTYLKDHRFGVIYNGIDAKAFLSTTKDLRNELKIPQTDFVIGHIGRYDIAKNHKLIIKVAINICNNYKDIHFILCGNNVVEGLIKTVEEYDLTDRIHLLNHRDDVIKVLNTIDCFYFPSITEGQPNALIEAMVAGLPFVASDIDPIKETVPEKLFNQLVSTTSVGESVSKLIDIYKGETSFNVQKWAIDNYNSEVLFEKFYKKL